MVSAGEDLDEEAAPDGGKPDGAGFGARDGRTLEPAEQQPVPAEQRQTALAGRPQAQRSAYKPAGP